MREVGIVSAGASIPDCFQTASAPSAEYSLHSGRHLRLVQLLGMLHRLIVVTVDFDGCDRGRMGRRGG